jgi:adenosylcobinamide-phosphate synthase
MVSRRSTALGAAAGLVLDHVLGDPPSAAHPVAWFGQAMGVLERRWWADDRRAGAAYCVAGLAAGAAAGVGGRSTALATWVATGARSLHAVALDVGEALAAGDLDLARELLPSLVGRDPDSLDATGIARAVIESVAENTTDAIVAPALWAALAGAPGVLVHRAADTMDSMVGHRTDRYERFGWAAARADDVLAWVPARVGVGLVTLVRPRRARAIVATVRRDAPAHPSPNAGMIEAAFAGALGLRLGGPTTYRGVVDPRPVLGDGREPRADDVAAAVALSREVTVALTAGLAVWGVARTVAPRRRR